MNKIPFSKVDIIDEDLKKISDVLCSGWLTQGKYTKQFEKDFSSYAGSSSALAVSTGTAALHLACLSVLLGKGDEVIVPAMTHTATAHAVMYAGATPVFVDVDPLYGNMDVHAIKEKITSKTKAIIIVHMAGFPCCMDEIVPLCKFHGLVLIEDCAHALGTRYNNRHVGTFGAAGCFSFYPTKQITTGEGGMLITNQKDIVEFCSINRAFGIDFAPEKRQLPGYYDVIDLGYNYRMTNFQAAMGCFQLERYSERLKKRQELARYYSAEFKALSEFIESPPYDPNASYFLFPILLTNSRLRNDLVIYLKENDVGVSIHYATPVPLMSYYREKFQYTQDDFPGAVKYANKNISLPVHPNLTVKELTYIFTKIKKFFLGKEVNRK